MKQALGSGCWKVVLASLLLFSALAGCATPPPPTPVAKIEACQPAAPCTTPLPVKVVIVTLFEVGADQGDPPGEFQFWKERRPWTQTIPFPQGFHELVYDSKNEVLAIVTGMGTAKSTAAIMALGLDQRFDLRKRTGSSRA